MKKVLFMISAAAVAFASCSNESTEYVGGNDNSPKEIAFKPLNQVQTRSAVSGTTFLDTDNFNIVAYLASGGSAAGDFFSSTLFSYDSGEGSSPKLWTGGENPRYWPLSASILNFLAVTNTSGVVSGKVSTTFGEGDTPSNYAKKAVVTLSSNNAWDQADLMYAAGQGRVTQSGNALTYGNNVSLVFQHALAWINFTVKTSTSATGLTVAVNSITLNGAEYNGTYTINNVADTGDEKHGYDSNAYTGSYNNAAGSAPEAAVWANLKGTWDYSTSDAAINQLVPNSAHNAAQGTVTLNSTAADFGAGLLVIPEAKATGFTINYTITQGGNENTYTYTYTFSDAEKNWSQRKKYTFAVDITLTEIKVAPSVTNWSEQSATTVTVPGSGS